MLAVSPLRSNKDGLNRDGDISFSNAKFTIGGEDFTDFPGGNLLDSIDFDDLFMGMHEGDVLPDLEMDPELLAEFSLSGGEESEANNSSSVENNVVSPNNYDDGHVFFVGDEHETCDNNNYNNGNFIVNGIDKSEIMDDGNSKVDETMNECKKEKESESTTTVNSSYQESARYKAKKSSSHMKSGSHGTSKDNQGKRKSKVDWTPELHRRFVQAVEQLGVDKAVPSRILELMGIDCLTRHNIASHLQKYRSHRKHLLAREAEAASWTQKRQMYGVAVGGGKGGANISPWRPPMMAFPPPTTMHHPLRPLHVWGHPTMDPQARMPMWPKQSIASPTAPIPPTWTPPPVDPSFWHSAHQRVPNAMTPAAAPCFPQPLPGTRFMAPPIPGIPPHAMYRPEHGGNTLPPVSQSGIDIHPSKESIDSAIGDVLAKPWLPLPIGLKPPSTDCVLVELQRQGVSKIPPTCA